MLVGRPRRRWCPPMASAPHRTPTFVILFLVLLPLSLSLHTAAALFNSTPGRPSPHSHHHHHLPGIQLPQHLSFNVASDKPAGCQPHPAPPVDASGSSVHGEDGSGASGGGASLKLHLRHRSAATGKTRKESVAESAGRDLHRIQTLHRRIVQKKNQEQEEEEEEEEAQRATQPGSRHRRHRAIGPDRKEKKKKQPPRRRTTVVTSLESGVTLGSGEYLADVFVGTPPRHFSLILDTGSDLNWLQCLPCHDCFEQRGPHYDPSLSSSYRPVPCSDPRCRLVSSPPDPHLPCRRRSRSRSSSSSEQQQQQQQQQPCPYFYWYGDRSNTTGDLALETFTVNLTTDGSQRVEDVIFGCGHWNRGLFHGAAGLLGLGRGPLSFASQLRSLYGGVFSYCLVDRNSDLSVTSKLILGDQDPELMSHGHLLNFTSLVVGSGQGQGGAVDTFYYVGVKGIMVGGRMLDIPAKTWEVSPGDGSGGTIVDSGTTLSYFAEPAYGAIREAFERGVKGYPRVEGVPVLSPCYNVSGVDKVELPEFAVVFGDGAVWNFPADNYFIRLEPEGVVCLALLGTSTLSILGNYQQQNFHVVYDAGRSRLGFAPATCADL